MGGEDFGLELYIGESWVEGLHPTLFRPCLVMLCSLFSGVKDFGGSGRYGNIFDSANGTSRMSASAGKQFSQCVGP